MLKKYFSLIAGSFLTHQTKIILFNARAVFRRLLLVSQVACTQTYPCLNGLDLLFRRRIVLERFPLKLLKLIWLLVESW